MRKFGMLIVNYFAAVCLILIPDLIYLSRQIVDVLLIKKPAKRLLIIYEDPDDIMQPMNADMKR